jgi:DNA-binding transcriptional ArsR family regulator
MNILYTEEFTRMSHNEVRDRILKTLYMKYYNESLGSPLDTDGILEETFHTKDLSKFYPEVNYLEDKGFIHGEQPSGDTYPKWIRIEEFGIDHVEGNEPDLRDVHYQKRLKILGYLYEKYFKGNISHISTDKIVTDTKIGDPNSSEIIREFNYLYEKRLIESNLQLGRKRVSDAKISTYGIDEIELILNQSLQESSNLKLSPTDRLKIDEIKKEQDTGDKFSKAIALSQEVREWLNTLIDVAQIFLGTKS